MRFHGFDDTPYRPLPHYSTVNMDRYDVICLHTMVGTFKGTDNYFRKKSPDTNSHFGVSGKGELVQWVPLNKRSAANYRGNHRVISIECEDMGDDFPNWNTNGSDVPAFTHAQLEALEHLIGMLAAEFDIPLVLIPDSLPNRRGIGWHRLGCDPWRVPNGELWSSARGKVCPGDRRITQIIELVNEYGEEELVLTPKQDAMLTVVFNQITGNDFQGWDKNWSPPGDFLTLVDLTRENIRLNKLVLEAISELDAKP